MKKIAMFVLALVVSLNIMPTSSEAKETQANKLPGFMYEYAINNVDFPDSVKVTKIYKVDLPLAVGTSLDDKIKWRVVFKSKDIDGNWLTDNIYFGNGGYGPAKNNGENYYSEYLVKYEYDDSYKPSGYTGGKYNTMKKMSKSFVKKVNQNYKKKC